MGLLSEDSSSRLANGGLPRSETVGSGDQDDRGGLLLDAQQVAELLGVPRSWVYEQSRTGGIPTVTLGRYRRYRRDAIEAWVRALERPARGA